MTDEPTTSVRKPARGMSESEIDDAIEASFPASDPPAWTLGTDHVDRELRRDRPATRDRHA